MKPLKRGTGGQKMISTIIQALCVGVMCAFCYRLGARGKDEMQHVIMMMLQRSEENDKEG